MKTKGSDRGNDWTCETEGVTVARPLQLYIVAVKLSDGGAERFTSVLLKYIDRELFRPELVLMRDDIRYEIPNDVPVHRLGYRRPLDMAKCFFRLRRLMRMRPDIVLSNTNATNILTGYSLGGLSKPPRWVARIGSNPWVQDSLTRRFLSKRIYSNADVIVTNSQGLRGCFEEIFPFLKDRIKVVMNPIDCDSVRSLAECDSEITPVGSRKLVVSVGRLAGHKRYDIALRSIARLSKHVDIEYWICGDGPLREPLETLARELGIGDRVRFLGFMDNPHAMVSQADLFLMTSEAEGLPNALLEAQVLGVPAVSTRCPYGPEEIMIDGQTGHLVTLGETGEIVSVCKEILLQPSSILSREDISELTVKRFDARELTRVWERTLLSSFGSSVDQESAGNAASP